VIRVARSASFRVDVDLAVAPGETVALLGPNGAGKSTIVAAVAGLLPLDGGAIALDGRVLDDPATGTFVPPEGRDIGVVFQDYLLFDHLTVVENVAFGLRARGLGRDEARARASSWLDRVGLDGLAERRPPMLSGGQSQRVALARALATAPDLLLLDEPLAALDVGTRAALRRELADHLAGFDGPRLLITHDPTEAFLLADRVFVVEDGQVTQSGDADEIRLRPRTPYAAELAGANLLSGYAADGVVDVDGHPLAVAHHDVAGPVLVMIRPATIAVHRTRPEGSPRNAWATSVRLVESLGDVVRVQTGAPLPLTAEVTAESARALGLETGAEIWVSIKATEIGVEAAG
jgi:molybdate transport system ATP-binding protein